MKIKLSILILFFAFSLAYSQDRFELLEEKLTQLSKNYPGLNDNVELSVNNVSIQDFVRAIGTNNNLNVNVEPTLDIKVANNFKNVSAKDVFMFLCRKHDLDITFVGPIMSFSKYVPPITPVKIPTKKSLNIKYESTADLLSFDLNADTLTQVTKEITKLSGKNIIFSPEVTGKLVSGFVQSAPFNNALEKLAFANDLKISISPDNFYIIEKKPLLTENKNNTNSNTLGTLGQNQSKNDGTENKTQFTDGLITLDVQNQSISEIVNQVSKGLNKNYFLFSELKGNTTIKIENETYDNFLKLLFNGTDFTFKKEGEIYLFGDRNLEGLRASKLITLKNRTIEKIMDFIPAELKKGVDLKLFEDLNGIIASGSQPRINELEAFLRQIDLVVPLVHIEVIIADVRKSNTLSAGISAGIGTKPANQSNGGVLPQVDLSFNATSINNLISGINGLGIINLGAVTPNFYLTLKALEQQGVLKLRSTPQIATLNGHEAKLSIGKTEYYLEVQNQLVNNTTVQQNLLQSQQYKPVNADLSLTIDPQVSGDEQITMTVNVKQSSFTERISNTAPPGTINRNFESLIRIKNGEMIMLGGLEENSTSHSGKGLPGISRIPVLRWIFGDRTKTKSENKLTIFIKPTIIYG
ncbi:MAG: type II and III secretion system protein [Bacteroidetes bacterium]|nr:type II and III secretion system protein [Bacteroidota bacterium]